MHGLAQVLLIAAFQRIGRHAYALELLQLLLAALFSTFWFQQRPPDGLARRAWGLIMASGVFLAPRRAA